MIQLRDTKLRKKVAIVIGKSMQTRTLSNDTISGCKRMVIPGITKNKQKLFSECFPSECYTSSEKGVSRC